MNVKVIAKKISLARWEDKGGGVHEEWIDESEEMLNNELARLNELGYTVKDVKVNHFVAQRHNNGGADEVWVQYTILY